MVWSKCLHRFCQPCPFPSRYPATPKWWIKSNVSEEIVQVFKYNLPRNSIGTWRLLGTKLGLPTKNEFSLKPIFDIYSIYFQKLILTNTMVNTDISSNILWHKMEILISSLVLCGSLEIMFVTYEAIETTLWMSRKA